MVEVINFMAAGKTGVSEAYANLNTLTGIDNAKAGLAAKADIKSKYVASMEVADGVITAAVQALDSGCDTKLIKLTPVVKDGSLKVDRYGRCRCAKFVPANFR